MVKVFPPGKIYIGNSSVVPSNRKSQFRPGRGVFAAEEIKKGEVVEEAPILILRFEDFVETRWNLLFEYYFWMDKYVVLALGYGGIYNHSSAPNCTYKILKLDKIIRFTALRDIKKGEEICFNYRGNTKSKTPLWFER